MFRIEGKVALVTGGASGIGLATIKEFLKNDLKGATIADVDEANGEEVVRSLSDEFGPNRVLFVKTDVTRQEEVEAAFAKTVEAFGNLDVVVNSAGIYNGKQWPKEIAVNLNGTVNVCLLGLDKYLPAHKTDDEAVIVNVSSVAGLGGIEAVPVYSATKHAIVGLSRSLGTEAHYDRTKVRVLTVCPGGTDTPLVGNLTGKFTGPQYEVLRSPEKFPQQNPQKVGEGIARVVREGRNGSIWVVNLGETFEVKLPELFDLLKRN